MPKKLFDVTFTISMSEKQRARLHAAEDMALLENDEDLPLWTEGLDFIERISLWYDVKAKLKKWTFRRNRADIKETS